MKVNEAIRGFPACHSERSEESLIILARPRKRNSLRCFASLNMTIPAGGATLVPEASVSQH
jgi:hypothetical protein